MPAGGQGSGSAADCRLRGLGFVRQRHGHQPADAGAGPARLRRASDQAAERDGAVLPVAVAILEQVARRRAHRHFRPLVVHARAGRMRRTDGLVRRSPRSLRGHPAIRAAIGRFRRGDRQVLAAYQPQGTAAAAQAAVEAIPPRRGRSAKPSSGRTASTTSG